MTDIGVVNPRLNDYRSYGVQNNDGVVALGRDIADKIISRVCSRRRLVSAPTCSQSAEPTYAKSSSCSCPRHSHQQ